MRHALILASILLGIGTTACQPSGPETPSATLAPPSEPEQPSSTPTSEGTARFAIPESIDAAYAEEVLRELYRVEGDALRAAVEAGEVTNDVAARIRAVYGQRISDAQLQVLREGANQGFPNLQHPVGDIVITVDEVLSADEDCAFVLGFRDYSAIDAVPLNRTNQRDFIQLLRIEPDQDPEGYNPTPWVIGGAEARQGASEPENPCAP